MSSLHFITSIWPFLDLTRTYPYFSRFVGATPPNPKVLGKDTDQPALIEITEKAIDIE